MQVKSRFLFFILLCISQIGWTTQNEKPFVTCELRGQLGNQLFIVATTLAYAWDHDCEAYFPGLKEITKGRSFNLEHLFFRVNTNTHPRPIQNEYQAERWHNPNILPFKPDVLLKGLFQSWRHFHRYRQRLLEVFAPTTTDLEYLSSKYSTLINQANTVAVHVRTYSVHERTFPFLGLEYYKQAFSLFPKDTLFVIFSDRIEWCQTHFPLGEEQVIFIDGNNHIQDLFLMSMMQHQIIGNSTYSWWGAYLNQNPNQIVIAPTYWMYSSCPYAPTKDILYDNLYLPEWIAIANELDPSYPEDLALVAPSKSLDNTNHPSKDRKIP